MALRLALVELVFLSRDDGGVFDDGALASFIVPFVSRKVFR
jgi:hypothetical protein